MNVKCLIKSRFFFIITTLVLFLFVHNNCSALASYDYHVQCDKDHCSIPFSVTHSSSINYIRASCKKKLQKYTLDKATIIRDPGSIFRIRKVKAGTKCRRVQTGHVHKVGWHKGGIAVTCYHNDKESIACNKASLGKHTIHITITCTDWSQIHSECD